jgi:hypothetical protein
MRTLSVERSDMNDTLRYVIIALMVVAAALGAASCDEQTCAACAAFSCWRAEKCERLTRQLRWIASRCAARAVSDLAAPPVGGAQRAGSPFATSARTVSLADALRI